MGQPHGGLVSGSATTAVRAAGLTGQEAARRLAVQGPNSLPTARRRHPGVLLAKQLVLRFLDEDSDVRGELGLIVSLPKAPYVRALATRAINRATALVVSGGTRRG
jgi:hypothetical protein